MTARIVSALGAALALLAGSAAAQQPPPPQPRALGPITNVAPDTLSAVSAAVQVKGGGVYVNDITAHRVLLFDSTLAHSTVVADSSAATANAYGPQPGTLLPFHSDSALFITPQSLSMLVLSPAGAITRVMAMPTASSGIPALIGFIFGTPGFDDRGRLLYYSPVRNIAGLQNFAQSTGTITLQPPDTALVVRFDFASRTLDTAATLHIARSHTVIDRDDSGRPTSINVTALPPSAIDDWAVLSDGTLAVLRGRDYHVDFLNADGSWTGGPRIPFAWERLGDEEKTALIDSVATALQTLMDSAAARRARAIQGGASGERPAGPGGPGGGGAVVIVGGGPGPAGGGGADRTAVTVRGNEGSISTGGGPPRTFTIPQPKAVKATLADAPDYRPPFRQGAVRADADDNLWIRTTKMVNGQPVYDIVNRRGELVDRLQLPPYRTIAGFGPGVVYLGVRDSSGAMHLERARVR